ncbi:MAG: SsrA-binding protein [Acidobacteria bacterium]|nr:MAG: SsrA-binding protein [Acidobacteriota bacterium]PIE89011.1 MAG: SsrA-binding protein [Acidobacteriota bacterium]
MGVKVVAENRKARFQYEIMEKLEAGIELKGSEVKSLRAGHANLGDGHVHFKHGEAFLESVHISPYSHGGYANHQPLRMRKLLMHKREIMRWFGKFKEKGLTAVPLKIYFKDGKAKVEVALVRGKKLHDKRETLRKKTMDREARTAMKERNWG